MGLSRILTPFLRVFRAPSYSSVVIEDLAQAELDLLQAHGQMEYAQAMLIYHTARVSRLRKVNFSAVREGPAAETYLPNSLRAVP